MSNATTLIETTQTTTFGEVNHTWFIIGVSFIVLFSVVVLILCYFGWVYYRSDKKAKREEQEDIELEAGKISQRIVHISEEKNKEIERAKVNTSYHFSSGQILNLKSDELALFKSVTIDGPSVDAHSTGAVLVNERYYC
eukprot:324515_1